MKKYTISKFLVFIFLIVSEVLSSQGNIGPDYRYECNADALGSCDALMNANRSAQDLCNSDAIFNCNNTALMKLLMSEEDYKMAQLEKSAGDITAELMGLLESMENNQELTNCLDGLDTAYGLEFDNITNEWHSCEEDPARGNCPTRHD